VKTERFRSRNSAFTNSLGTADTAEYGGKPDLDPDSARNLTR
jgi:hypothetical protein